MNKEIEFLKKIENALLKDDITALQSGILDLAIYLRDHYKKFPEEVFAQMVYLFKSDSFNKNVYGFPILDMFLDDSEYLDENIKRQLVELMELIYPNILTPATGIRVTEGIIDLADNEQALDILMRLEKKCIGFSKTLIPNALNYFCSNCGIPKLRENAILLLKELASDQDEDVRGEAIQVLDGLT